MSNQINKNQDKITNEEENGHIDLYVPFKKGYQPVMSTINTSMPPTDGTGVPEKVTIKVTDESEQNKRT